MTNPEVIDGQLSTANSIVLVTLLDDICEATFSAVVAIEVHGHENTRPAQLVRTFFAQALDFVVGVHLVELQHSKLHLLLLVLDFLRLRVSLLLTLLTSALETQRDEESGLVLHTALREQ